MHPTGRLIISFDLIIPLSSAVFKQMGLVSSGLDLVKVMPGLPVVAM